MQFLCTFQLQLICDPIPIEAVSVMSVITLLPTLVTLSQSGLAMIISLGARHTHATYMARK